MIDGYKHNVQIDEMYVGHRKYNKGRSPASDNQCRFVGGINTKQKIYFMKKWILEIKIHFIKSYGDI